MCGKSRKGKGLPLVPAVHKQLHQRTHARGVKERHFAHVQHKVRCTFRARRLNEIVNGLQAEFALQPQNEPIRIGACYFFQIKSYGLHEVWKSNPKLVFQM